ncbi:hypothetical protein BDV32DRAFT_128460 [Aspergillus pseudonomiae]|nr:hypothetical protein BDV32DRAFT_128460 [Aspergillus pseudonomiae]
MRSIVRPCVLCPFSRTTCTFTVVGVIGQFSNQHIVGHSPSHDIPLEEVCPAPSVAMYVWTNGPFTGWSGYLKAQEYSMPLC